MIKKFINIIKLTKYSENSLINFLSFLVFEGFGLYLMLTTESTLISCLLMFVGSFMLATIFYNLSSAESIMASPLGKTLHTKLPNGIMLFCIILTYVLLTFMINIRCNEQSSLYSIYSIEEAYTLYLRGMEIILIATLLFPIILQNFSSGIIRGVILYFVINITFFILGNVLSSFIDINLNLTILNIVFFILFAGVLFITFYAKPFRSIGNRYGGIKAKKLNTKQKYILISTITVLVAILITGSLILKSMLTSDGMYDYAKLKSSYKDILQESGDTLIVQDIKVTLDKYYYDNATNDACCLLHLEGENALEIEYEEGDSFLKVTQYHPGHSSFICNSPAYWDDDLEHCYKLESFYVNTAGTGHLDIDYEIDDSKPNSAYVYLYINMLPNESDNIEIKVDFTTITLSDNLANPTLANADEDIKISPSALVYTENRTPTDINIILDSGKKISIMKDSIMADGIEMYKTNKFTKFLFNDLIDINTVKDVEIIENENVKNVIENDTYLIVENSHMRKTMYYELSHSVADVTTTFEWIQMPKHKFTDIIDITFSKGFFDRGYFSIWSYDFSQKVFDNESKQWIEKDIEIPTGSHTYVDDITNPSKEITQIYYLSYDNVFNNESNVGYYDYDRLIVFPTIFKDEKYSNQTITIKYRMQYDPRIASGNCDDIYILFPPQMHINYTHYISNFKGFYKYDFVSMCSYGDINNKYFANKLGRSINYGFNFDLD